MKLNLEPGFDGDMEVALDAIQRGWITIEQVEQAIESVDRSPGTRLLNHLPLTPDQLTDLESPAPVALPPEVAAVSQDPARRVDHYILVEHLGTGGMGVVHKAWDLKLSRWVALKFLKSTGDDAGRAYFEREARLAAGLSHPNIAAIYEVGRREQGPFISMQYVPGQRLEQRPRKNLKKLVALIRDAARAVGFANLKGVIHRDLKPSNLMVTPEGHLYVMDFGVAWPVEGPGHQTVSGSSGSVVGTPEYMAPEQARGEDVDGRSDVYSLGATLYEVLTGKAPFKGSNVYEVLRKVEEEEPRRIRKINPRIPPDLETIVLKCLEKDPARRYDSGDLLADDLERYLEGEPIQARPPSPLYRLRMKLTKRKALVAVAAAGLAAVGGLSLFLIPRWREAARTTEAGRSRTEARGRAEQHIELARYGLKSMEQMQAAEEDHSADLEREGRQVKVDLEKALATYPDHEEAWFEMGRLEGFLGRDPEAVERFSKAIECSPGMAKAYLERAMLNLEAYEELRHNSSGFKSGRTVKPDTEKSAHLLAIIKTDLGKVREWSKNLPHLKGAEAMLLFADGKWGDAAECWKEYLGHWPADARAWEWYGHALIHADRPGDAVKALDRAVLLRPRHHNAHDLLGLAHVRLKNFDRAITALGVAIGLKPTCRAAYFNRGFARQSLMDFEGANEDFTKAINLDPKDADAYNTRGSIRCDSLRDYVGAIQDFTKAIQLDPKFALPYTNRGNARNGLRDYEEASQDFTKAIGLDPNYADAYCNRGVSRSGLNDQKGAIEDFTKAIGLDPNHAHAYNNRGVLLSGLNDHKAAIEDFNKAIVLDPNFAPAYTNRGIAWNGLKDYEKAIQDFTKTIGLDPNYAKAYFGRGFSRTGLNDYKRAIEDFTKAIGLDPNSAPAYNNRGNARNGLKEYEEAIRDFEKAIGLDPKFAPAYSNRGIARNALRDYTGAVSDYTKAIDLNPNDAWSCICRGAILCDALRDYEGAIRDFDRAIKLDPQNAVAYGDRGAARSGKGDYLGAIQDYDRVIKLDPKCAFAYYSRGWTLFILKDYDRAIPDLEKSIQLTLDRRYRVNAAYDLSCAYALKGDKPQALDWLEKAMEMGWTDVAHIEKDTDLESLRQEDRYKKLTEKLKAK